MKKVLLIAYFTLHVAFFLKAQTPEIRCKVLLDEMTSKLMISQKESEFRAKLDEYDRLYPKIKNNGWWKGQSELLNGGYYLFFKKDILKSKSLMLESEQSFKESNNPKDLIHAYFWLGIVSEEEKDLKQATEYFFKVIEFIEKYGANENRILAISYDKLGEGFVEIGNKEKALFYKKKAAETMSQVAKTGNYDTKKYPNSNIVKAYDYLMNYNKIKQVNNLDSAFKIAQREYPIVLKQNNLQGQSQLLDVMIIYHSFFEKYDDLLKVCDKAIKIGNQVDGLLVKKALFFKIDALIGKQKYKEALSLSDDFEEMISQESNKFEDSYQKDNLKMRLKIFKATGQLQKALDVSEELLKLEKQTTVLKKTKIINDLEIRYETEKKKKEILVLTAQNQIKSARIKQKNYLIFAISALVLLLCGGFFFWFRQRKLKDNQRASDMKQRLLRAQLNPHFLFNCLNSIQRLYVDGKFMQANEFIADFAQLMRDILEKTGRTTIPLYEEMDFIEAYLSLEKRRLGDKFDYEIIMDDDVRNGDYEVPSFIVQPLAENALLHGILPKNLRGKIEVIVDRMKDNSLSITVIDDGVGYYHSLHKAGKHTSKGMELIKSRLGKQGKMLIEELKNLNQEILGTKITLELNMQ